MRLAVIIPTLNEKVAIAATLESLLAQKPHFDILVVADGGSTDGTLAVADQHGATIVTVGKPGRGNQVATALRHLDHDVVLIVHADAIVPAGALALLRERLAELPDCPGGCLGHRFDSPSRLLRWTEWWDERRARRGMSYGDQAQFFRRARLEEQGGFPAQPIMEDVELSRRLKRLGHPIYLDCPVIVSPRRYAQLGWLRTTLGNFLIRLTYRLFGQRACAAIHRYYYGRA
jgi:rSAM/selenodomain-associated transferase 2